MLGRCILSCVAALAVTASAAGQCVFDSMSDGSDGDLSPQLLDKVIDLGLAATGSWNTPGDGDGVYDPDRWVVVFKYAAINIPPNLTVTFINHPSGAPVVWLASEDVVIAGTVKLNGEGEFTPNGPFQYAKGGPGGFDGGAGGNGRVRQEIMGNQDLETTMIYVNLAGRDVAVDHARFSPITTVELVA